MSNQINGFLSLSETKPAVYMADDTKGSYIPLNEFLEFSKTGMSKKTAKMYSKLLQQFVYDLEIYASE